MHAAARVGTAGLLATGVVGVSVVAHVAAGGAAHLGSPLFLIACGVVFAAVSRLPIRQWSTPIAATVMLLSQLALHLSMQLRLPSVAAFESVIGMSGMSGMSSATPPNAVLAHATTAAGAAMPALNSVSMLLTHLLAGIAALVIIRRGDKAIASLLEFLAVVLPSIALVAAPVMRLALPTITTDYRVDIATRCCDEVVLRRGPPALPPTPALSIA